MHVVICSVHSNCWSRQTKSSSHGKFNFWVTEVSGALLTELLLCKYKYWYIKLQLVTFFGTNSSKLNFECVLPKNSSLPIGPPSRTHEPQGSRWLTGKWVWSADSLLSTNSPCFSVLTDVLIYVFHWNQKCVCPQYCVSFFPCGTKHGIKYQYIFYIQSRNSSMVTHTRTHRCQASTLVVGNGCPFSAILVRLPTYLLWARSRPFFCCISEGVETQRAVFPPVVFTRTVLIFDFTVYLS